jgi:hypothetical protein
MSSIRSLLLLALAATPSLATRICGTSKPGQKLVETHARHAHKSALARVSGKPADIRSEPFSATIDTWMHVIGIDGVNDESSENYVSASTLSKQVRNLS